MNRTGGLRPLLALRMSLKGLARSPGTSVLAVGILALGLAAPTVFFSLLVGAIRPLPVPDGARIVRVDVLQPGRDGRPLDVRLTDLTALAGLASLESLGAFRTSGVTIVDVDVAASRAALAEVTPEVLPLLRVAPSLGRISSAAEAARTVLLGHELWLEMYDGDPDVLGRSVTIGTRSRVITGVMPEGFGFPFNQNAWVLIDPDEEGDEPVELVGRLADGSSVAAASSELTVRWARGDALRDVDRTGGVAVVDSYTGSRGEAGETVAFVALVLVALCLLLIACANVANLLLVRAAERVRALGIQSALGASRGQIGTQLLTESALLALVGGAIGLALAGAGVAAIQQALAAEHFGYFWMRMAIDGPVVAFATVLVLGTAVVSGTVPALRVMAVDVRDVLQRENGGGSIGAGGRWSRLFVTVQLAFSCAALVAAGLTARSLHAARDFAGDVPADEILIATVGLEEGWGEKLAGIDAITEALRRTPGVAEAAVAAGAPGFGEPWSAIELDGAGYDRPEDRESVLWNAVTPEYFAMVDVSLRSGRLLGDGDGADGPPVAVVNESFVRRFSTDRDVLGRSVRLGDGGEQTAWHTVVGVVEDTRIGTGELVRQDRVYVPLAQARLSAGLILLRGDDPAGLAPELRRAVAAFDPTIALSGVRTLEDGHAYMTRVPRAMGALALGGGLAGLLVAAVGLYGLLAFRVRQRRRELGVRLALGASGRRLALDTLDMALRQLLPAIAIGLSLAWLVGPVLGVIVLGMNPRSPSTLGAVGIVFLVVGLVAAALPTARAASTDPAHALRG